LARLHLLGGGAFEVDKVLGIDPAEDTDPCVNTLTTVPGGAVKPLCDLTGIRELTIDDAGNVFVASATQYNENDWVLIYNGSSGSPGYETARVKLNELFESEAFDTPLGPAAPLISSYAADALYLAASVNMGNGLVSRVYRFSTSPGGVTFTGVVEIEHPEPAVCGEITCDGFLTSITSMQEAADGRLYVVGTTAPDFSSYPGFVFELVSGLFTTPTLAVIPAGATWSTSVPAEVYAGSTITGCDLGLPMSAVLVSEAGPPVPGDYDGDGDVDLDDYAWWDGCMTGPEAGPYAPGCEAFDFDVDTDVDLADFGGFQRAVAALPE
jgi:hypothetical protein